MNTNSHKFKQYLIVALKVFILGVSACYIYLKLSKNTNLEFQAFIELLSPINSGFSILFFVFLASLNWYFECLKWKIVVSKIQSISFFDSLQQSLSALTISLATPNRIGDYGAKAFFYKKEHRKQILLLNFFSNTMQMVVTAFFGFIGLCYLTITYSLEYSNLKILGLLLSFSFCLFLAYFFRNKQLLIKGLSINNVLTYIKNLNNSIQLKTLIFSIIRYVIFSYLFFKILCLFGVNLSLFTAMPIIFSMYLITSIIPTIFIFDVVVKGGAAVWLFSLEGIPELPILCTVLSMWLLNFVIPSIFGGVFMFTYQSKYK